MEKDDYFSLFGLGRDFAIDLELLESAYQRLSLKHHPDFFATASAGEKQNAEAIAARLNEGYRVLKSDGLRAEYLLSLLSAGRELNREQLPDGFLQDMFLLQEEADELEQGGDGSRRSALKSVVGAKLSEVENELAQTFEGAAHAGSDERLQHIQTLLNCRRYLERLSGRFA